MSSIDLDQVLYARAGWRKALLIPLWMFQIAVLLCLMAIFAYRLAETFDHYEELDKLGEVPIVEVVWEATNVGFNLIALVLNILEVARYATERLTPFMMICTHVVKLTLALAVLALDIVAYLQHMDGHYSTIGLSLDCGLLAANIATFIYALTTYRRLLQYESYHLTANAKAAGGFVTGGGDTLELGHPRQTHGVTTTITTGNSYSDDTAYPSQTQSTPHSYIQPYNPQPAPSGEALKKEVDRAIGGEFGWHDGGNGSGEAVNRSGSVVLGGGKVAVHHPTAATGGEVHRMQSLAAITERGGEEGVVMGRVGGGEWENDREGLLK
ncbi:hypothetical protein C8A05DRAFT_19340 [Staphylotrichum tortipilum]|uniref:Transmembrane protein n=1 Tax=Staphylotrichum tortipilum TaxID=2831512 RepID=A0AAN6MCN9_9PEZI|nr:hypothetical protein C8A05DRAFT_19340 [Staphylotrichum longicolle]